MHFKKVPQNIEMHFKKVPQNIEMHFLEWCSNMLY